MTAATAFALRPLERTSANQTLKEGFRVQLSDKELKNLGLVNGDLIRITSPNRVHGFALAWLAKQTNAGNKAIAKVSDLLRDEYQLKLTDSIFIEEASNAWRPAESVEVIYAQPSETLSTYSSTEELAYWIRHALVELEMIVAGCTFEVQPKGSRHQQRTSKLRVTIVNINPPPDENAPYFHPLASQIVVLNDALESKTVTPDAPIRISGEGIGGLSTHIETINKRLGFSSISASTLRDTRLTGSTSFLIHGPEGCGKTLLLERLSMCPWRKVFTLDQEWLSDNRKEQAQALSEDVFKAARSLQPALILIDELDKFLQKAETLVSRLRQELRKLGGTQVVVATAARSVYDVDSSLRHPAALNTEIEVSPPNMLQRQDMLRQIIGPIRKASNVDFNSLAERSHGFVGRDIDKLCWLARDHREQQVYESLEPGEESTLGDVLENMDFVTQDDFDSVFDQIQPTVLKDSILEVPKVRWTDIAGVDHVREELDNITVRPYKHPDLSKKFPNSESRKGVLLFGPPGCAKTLIAKAVATESNLNFLAVKGSELIKMYVGESERGIRDIFRRARTAKPCVIFFDEIDSIGKSREKSQDSGLNVVATLLNEMDGIEALKDVFIIAATNRPDILDSALIRPGRFDAHIHIGLPNEDARRQIFEIHTREWPLAGDVDLNILASHTEGSSGADIKGLCTVANELAKSDYEKSPERQPEVRMCHFERALDQHVPHTTKDYAARFEGWRPGKSLTAV